MIHVFTNIRTTDEKYLVGALLIKKTTNMYFLPFR